MKPPIYMDYHATTPVDPRVLEVMLPYFTTKFGNPASKQHSFGWEAEVAVDKARAQVASLLSAHPEEICFTGGATESNNLAFKGLLESFYGHDAHLITTAIEHSSILELCEFLEKKGVKISLLPVDSKGRLDLDLLKNHMTENTRLVSVMMANNEIGTLQNISEIGRICKERGIVFHTDAAQALGKCLMDVDKMHIDLLSISGHKNYAPKGVGALYIRSKNPKIQLQPILHGGGQEKGLRSGTLNVPGIVGLGKACEISQNEMQNESARLQSLRDSLQNLLLKKIPDLKINGCIENRLPHNLNVTIPGVRSEVLMMNLKKDVALSSGSACSSAHPKTSHVLKAIGLTEEEAHHSIRFGLGRFTTSEEMDYTAKRVTEEVQKIRG